MSIWEYNRHPLRKAEIINNCAPSNPKYFYEFPETVNPLIRDQIEKYGNYDSDFIDYIIKDINEFIGVTNKLDFTEELKQLARKLAAPQNRIPFLGRRTFVFTGQLSFGLKLIKHEVNTLYNSFTPNKSHNVYVWKPLWNCIYNANEIELPVLVRQGGVQYKFGLTYGQHLLPQITQPLSMLLHIYIMLTSISFVDF